MHPPGTMSMSMSNRHRVGVQQRFLGLHKVVAGFYVGFGWRAGKWGWLGRRPCGGAVGASSGHDLGVDVEPAPVRIQKSLLVGDQLVSSGDVGNRLRRSHGCQHNNCGHRHPKRHDNTQKGVPVGERSWHTGRIMCRQRVPHMCQWLAQAERAMLAKRVWWGRKARRVLPVGPVRCLATITSAVPASVVSGWALVVCVVMSEGW